MHALKPLEALALAACFLLLLPACQGSQALENLSDNITGDEEKKDQQAREHYYETSALTFYDGGNYERAEIMAERWLEEEPGNKKARRVLARSKLNQGTPAKLREAEDILLDLVDLPWSHPTRGDISWEVKMDLAQVYTNLADLYDRDVRALDRKSRLDPGGPGSQIDRQLATQVRKRDALIHKAMPLWENVLHRSPRHSHALAALAKGHLQLGQNETGLTYAKQYLALSQQNQRAYRAEMKRYEAYATQEHGVGLDNTQRAEFVNRIHRTRAQGEAHASDGRERAHAPSGLRRCGGLVHQRPQD